MKHLTGNPSKFIEQHLICPYTYLVFSLVGKVYLKTHDLVKDVHWEWENCPAHCTLQVIKPTSVIGHENSHAQMSAFLAIISAIFTRSLQLKWSETNNCI